MNDKNKELERVCFNCNSFFPADSSLTEYGICLMDESFEPYIEELFEKSNYDCCRDLINNSKFDGNRDACKNFEPIERIEIDNELEEGIRELAKNKNLTIESLKGILLENAIKKIDWKNRPIEPYMEMLKSGDKRDVLSAINSLDGLSSLGNDKAFIALFKYYKKLPAAKNLEEVYFKINVLRKLEYKNDRKELVDCLVDELYKTPSNNTTRSLILKIFKIMKSIPIDLKKEALEKMLKDKRFSYRLKEKMKNMLDYYEDEWFYAD